MYTLYRDFNSIKVRLKRTLCRQWNQFIVFQFHKGTIKTPVKSKAYKPRRLYRFAGAKIQKNLQKNVDA